MNIGQFLHQSTVENPEVLEEVINESNIDLNTMNDQNKNIEVNMEDNQPTTNMRNARLLVDVTNIGESTANQEDGQTP